MTNRERYIERLKNEELAPHVVFNTNYECFGCVHNPQNECNCKYDFLHPIDDIDYCVSGITEWLNKEVG